VILFLKISLEVDGRVLSPYSQVPTDDPTQRLRGNPITLNLKLYNDTIIYIIFYLKDLFVIQISTRLKFFKVNWFLLENHFLYNQFNIIYNIIIFWSWGLSWGIIYP
jgi:hypothetical protein